MELLSRFDPESEVRLSVSLPGRVIATHENLWVADYGGGPQLHAALDFKQFHVYVGCGMEQLVTNVPPHPFDPSLHDAEQEPTEVDLGEYENEEIAAQVRDFYNYHRRPSHPLKEPDFDYETSRLRVKRRVANHSGQQHDRLYSIRLYALHEIRSLLERNGFRVDEISGREATMGIFFGVHSPKMIIRAHRLPGLFSEEGNTPPPVPSSSMPATAEPAASPVPKGALKPSEFPEAPGADDE